MLMKYYVNLCFVISTALSKTTKSKSNATDITYQINENERNNNSNNKTQHSYFESYGNSSFDIGHVSQQIIAISFGVWILYETISNQPCNVIRFMCLSTHAKEKRQCHHYWNGRHRWSGKSETGGEEMRLFGRLQI